MRRWVALPLIAFAGTALAQQAPAGSVNRIVGLRLTADGAVEVTCQQRPNFTTLNLESPPRLVVDFADTVLADPPHQTVVHRNGLASVATSAFASDTGSMARIVFTLEPDSDADLEPVDATRVRVRITSRKLVPAAVASTAAPDAAHHSLDSDVSEISAREAAEKQAAAATQQAQAARVQSASDAQAKLDAEAKAKAASQAASAAEARAKAASDAQAQAESDAQRNAAAKADAEAKARAAADDKSKAEQTAQELARAKAAADARAEQERAAKDDAEAKTKAMEQRLAQLEAQQKQEAQARQDAEARAKADAAALAKAQAEAKAADAARDQAEADRVKQAQLSQEQIRQAAAQEEKAKAAQALAQQQLAAANQRAAQASAAQPPPSPPSAPVAAAPKAPVREVAASTPQRDSAAEARAQAELAERDRLRQAQAAQQAQAADESRAEEKLLQDQRDAERAAQLAKAHAAVAERPVPRREVRVASVGGPERVAGRSGLRDITLVGFKATPEGGRAFIKASEAPRFSVSELDATTLVVDLADARISQRNNALPLDTSFFPGAVALISPAEDKKNHRVRVEIRLKEPVPYQARVEGTDLVIDFQGPPKP